MGPDKGQDQGQGQRPQQPKTVQVPPGNTSFESTQQCPSCGMIMDSIGCPACDLLREQDEGEADDVPADKDGKLKGDKTKSGLPSFINKIKDAETQESKSANPDDGITSEMGGMGKDLGQNDKVKNKGGQHEEFKGGNTKMEENVKRLATAAKRSIQETAGRLRNNDKYRLQFVLSCSGVKPRLHARLSEALVDTEELIQAYGPAAVVLESRFYGSNGKLVAKQAIKLPNIAQRDPIVSEGKVIFRFPEVANDFADQVVTEGAACRVVSHNWGAAVAGKFNWKTASKAFSKIPATVIYGDRK